jgi:hypothetical protein
MPIDLQNIYITNIELGIKIALFCFVIYFCYSQVQKLKEKRTDKKTPYFLVAYVRGWVGLISHVIIWMSPLIGLFIFYPGIPMEKIQNPVLGLYIVIGFIVTAIILVNVLFFSSSILMGFAGYDRLQKRNNQVLNDLEKYSGGFKLARNKLLNKLGGKWR